MEWNAMLVLGAYHGINPGMGWLFAVALGMQQRSAWGVLSALPPIALGHAVAVGVVVLAAGLAGLVVPLGVLKGGAIEFDPPLPERKQRAIARLGFGVLNKIALLYDDSASEGGHPHLFTGDSLFPGGVGNTFGDAAAFQQLVDDVENKLFARLPDDTWFYPGHGNDSTLGVERPHLAEWRARGW